MSPLLLSKLTAMPIGTFVQVTFKEDDDHLQKVIGIVTNNDFQAALEITDEDDCEFLIEYDQITGVTTKKKLAAIIRELPAGTKIRYSQGTPEDRVPDATGVITANDGVESLAVENSDGEEDVVQYDMIRSLLVLSAPKQKPETGKVPDKKTPEPVREQKTTEEKPKEEKIPEKKAQPPLYEQTPDDFLNRNDSELKTLFDQLPRIDKKKLSGCFDSFLYGIKNTDMHKMTQAANQARQILFREDDARYLWSVEAARFVGFLLRRVNIYDESVFLVGECFQEAAYAAAKAGKFSLAGAYAIASLVLEQPGKVQDLLIILAGAVVKGKDISGLPLLRKHLPGFDGRLRAVIEAACQAKQLTLDPNQDPDAALDMLRAHYPGTEMGEEARYWLRDDQNEPQPSQQEAPQETTPVAVETYGVITRIDWSNRTGTITSDAGETYSFRYEDIADKTLYAAVDTCMRGDLGGKTYLIKFNAIQRAAQSIVSDASYVNRARTLVTNSDREDRLEVAFALCKMAVGTQDTRRALEDLVQHALSLYTAKQDLTYIVEALELYEKNATLYANNAFNLMRLAQCYQHVKKYPQMLEFAKKAVSFPGQSARQKNSLLSTYLQICKDYYAVCGDQNLLTSMVERADAFANGYTREFATDKQLPWMYQTFILPHRIYALCGLDRLKEAEADFAQLPGNHNQRAALAELIAATRERLKPKPEPVPVAPPAPEPAPAEPAPAEPEEEESVREPEFDEPLEPYTDADGWEALKLTGQEVIDYALNITGPDRIPAILAYLRAGAEMNPEIEPVYNVVALAANDPMEGPDYSITALSNVLDSNDSRYHALNDCCMAAAFLRASFISGRDYDFAAQSLRDSIAISQQIPALREVYDTLETFRKESGRAIDIYADYRNHDAKKITAQLTENRENAEDLYTKFIIMPPRESAKFTRLVDAKKLVFAKDGYLGTMLRHVIDQNLDALEAEKNKFVSNYLSSTQELAEKTVRGKAVDEMISDVWSKVGVGMTTKKGNDTLQGDRRNNLRSNITEILKAVHKWYVLHEQNASLTWITEQGAAVYQRLRPRLLDQLAMLRRECILLSKDTDSVQLRTGLFLLDAAAGEMIARLEGSWKVGIEKFLYADFLRGNDILLDENFLPDLSSTFCVLPEFNILARIRHHVENEKLSFHKQVSQIFGIDKTCNNYGTAGRIIEYLDAIDSAEAIALPDDPAQFINHTEMQIDMRMRGFLESYALATSYGQIIKSEPFCNTLENTVRYWYVTCKQTKNYGFFISLLRHVDHQIHVSARQYEQNLYKQLDALVSGNETYFTDHPGYEEAIRAQIANQNFTVAEDWMSRIRHDDFSLDVARPEALDYLEQFWRQHTDNYDRVHNTSWPLRALLPRRDPRYKDARRAEQMINSWPSNGGPSSSDRIEQLLTLLGWQGVHATPFQFPTDPRAEIYEVRKEVSSVCLSTPLHPIAAFGSGLDKRPMYVICLYGIYDCDRLYAKMNALDSLEGHKIFLLDYALGMVDRRTLAWKLKKRDSGLRYVNLLIDRVLIAYLSNLYKDNLINRILMAAAMPFAYYQPYVVESIHTMPPEIFIGRKDELRKIEQPDGVNLIYGGRQLGKSALFKQAVADLDGYYGQRAVLIDINKRNCAAAAVKVSTELIEMGLTPDAEVTDDWDVLCSNIKRMLREKDSQIRYFLLMLDEADTFIEDCANYEFMPMVALKDVQQSLPGRFKYVLAGLHNVVKFHRQVALGNNNVISHIPSLKITPFRTPEAQELLTLPLSYLGFSLPSKVIVSQILATCNYFPGLIQLYASKLIESIRSADYAGYDIGQTPPYVISDDHLRRVIADRDFTAEIYNKFEMTLTLDEKQGSYYYPLALLIGWMYSVVSSKGGYTAQDVFQQAQDLAIQPLANLDVEKIDVLMQELQDLNILRSVSANSYLLASKNFRDLLGSDEEIFEKLEKIGGKRK